MNISNYVKMNYEELANEVTKQKKKIKSAQETIKLLEKLQLAESAKSSSSNSMNQFIENGEVING